MVVCQPCDLKYQEICELLGIVEVTHARCGQNEPGHPRLKCTERPFFDDGSEGATSVEVSSILQSGWTTGTVRS